MKTLTVNVIIWESTDYSACSDGLSLDKSQRDLLTCQSSLNDTTVFVYHPHRAQGERLKRV